MSRRNGTSSKPKHGNPGGTAKSYRHNQSARDLARQRGHEARDEMMRVRRRATELSGLHGSVNALVRQSNIIPAANQRTNHLDLDQFCAYTDELADRLFRLEQQIVRSTKRDIWRHDSELMLISRALILEKRAQELTGGKFEFKSTGISVMYPSASGHFALTEDGLSACAKIVLCCEEDEVYRLDRQEELLSNGEVDSYKLAEQQAHHEVDARNFDLLSRRSPLLPAPSRKVR